MHGSPLMGAPASSQGLLDPTLLYTAIEWLQNDRIQT